jgi:hypothetical protein
MRYAIIAELNTESGHLMAFTMKARESIDASAAQRKLDAILWELQKRDAIPQWRATYLVPVLRFREWLEDGRAPKTVRDYLAKDWAQLPEMRYSKSHGLAGAFFGINPQGRSRTYQLQLVNK